MTMQDLIIDNRGALLVNKNAIMRKGVYSDVSYRASKSRERFSEVVYEGSKWVVYSSLPPVTRDKVMSIFSGISARHAEMLNMVNDAGENCVPVAVGITAESLSINEPFIRSSLEAYMGSHYMVYTSTYLDMGISASSVKGYARQCAMIQWIYDYAKMVRERESDKITSEILLRSFRMNVLTALRSMKLEVKVPLSETRFNGWFDKVMKEMDKGTPAQEIIQPKRIGNSNGSKISEGQLNVAVFWHTNGLNMSVRQVHKKWLEYGKKSGWWMDTKGQFTPPSEARLYQLLQPLKNANSLEKTDAVVHRANFIPGASRHLPPKKNHVWVIDGTAHNENVEYQGKVRQHIYAIKVADAGSLRLVGASALIGVREPFSAVKEAILMGIRETGYRPAYIQSDRGPAANELALWCEENGIKLKLTAAGNARAKIIESMFNMFDNALTKFRKSFSGMNRTTRSQRSKSSDKREMKGKRNAISASVVMEWVKSEGLKEWNEHIIETLEGKPCGKTPFELWDEKESYTPKMSYSDLCRMCGTLHERKLTTAGLDIDHNRISYTYFPKIETPEQRAAAEEIFTRIPMDARTANRLKIYILKGGDPAPVFTPDDKFLGMWTEKPRTEYIAETDEELKVLNNFMALQKRVENKAKEINLEVRKSIEMHPDYEHIKHFGEQAPTGRKREYTGRYDKSELLTEEVEFKASDLALPAKYRELVDPDTGEIITVKIN